MPNVSLKIRIAKSAPMQELDALDTVSVTATALNYIYNRRGLVHRNLKPSNILFNAGDEIEISDYGLADWTSEYLTAGVSAASPWYISPEQVSGDEMDWYSDLYSLGIILFQMLTGVLPFHSMNEEEVLSMHINNPLPSPESRNPNVKLHSETIEMLRAMTVKAPSRRYSSWTDFLNTIQNLYEKIESEGYNSEPFKPEHTNPPDEPMTSSRIKKQKLRNSNGELE
jgi:serine/threonine-protein kinase